MMIKLGFILLLVLGCTVTISAKPEPPKPYASSDAYQNFNRTSFPPDFMFGAAGAAYQFEGAAKEGGRGPSVWDTFTHKYPDKITDRSNGDVAVDSYHRIKEDVGILKDMGWDFYRFSISWSRLLPNGKLSGGVNMEGVNYYKNLLNELQANGIKPFVTLFHWDFPQALEDEYRGFLSPNSVSHFRDYADLCFKEFGDKVKHWITLNEPQTYSVQGYTVGAFAPGRCSNHTKCKEGGNSATEPYLAAYHQLLAHATAVKVYRDKYQATQKGVIGIALNSGWSVPLSDSMEDKGAAMRALDFSYGWFMDPLTRGRYPKHMVKLVGSRLPKFTEEQSNMLKGSYDFIGLNYYSSSYAKDVPVKAAQPSQSTDAKVESLNNRNGVLIGPMAASNWLYVYPQGLLELLSYTKRKYKNPVIYITENGVDEANDPKLSLEQALIDKERIKYYDAHLYYVQEAIKKGINVKGFFAWSLLDNFEWANGYTVRFGVIYVDYKNGLKRHYKLSARWWKNLLSRSGPKHDSSKSNTKPSKGTTKNLGSKPKSSKGDIL
ncbi:beta-glucosidase 24 [Pyrus x bretschneideri]|uniref:beta-glucosidase 24 n=1 Tax=Pyrus x bretschneideri TaxID=225117 RepID=UPI00202DC24A|nr:beta-glucosidase 24 [Pyrus x bretschneideri]